MGLREEKKRETRAAIADAAMSLFRATGFDDTRVRDIAREVRVSEATFFNYFRSKQAVLDAAASALVDRSVERLRAAQNSEAPLHERLDGLVTAFAADFGGDHDLAVLIARHSRMFAGELDDGAGTTHRRLVVELFEDARGRGDIRDDVSGELLADMWQASMQATIQGWLGEEHGGEPLVDRMRAAVHVILHGCTSRAAALT